MAQRHIILGGLRIRLRWDPTGSLIQSSLARSAVESCLDLKSGLKVQTREKAAVNVLERPATCSSFLENECLAMIVGVPGVVQTLWSSGTAFANLI